MQHHSDMAHDHNHDHNSDGGSLTCPMIMTFHGGHCENILWKNWLATTVTELVLSALAIFLVAFLYEALKFLREKLLRQHVRKENERITLELQQQRIKHNSNVAAGSCPRTSMVELKQKTYTEKILTMSHFVQCCLYLIQIILSYLLMLIFMTFNYWLCLAIILGLGCGYFFFGWIKQDIYENECCQ